MTVRQRRLGFPVKVMGAPDLKSNDTRRWQQNPHLRVSIAYLDTIFTYPAGQGIALYRMASDLAPYATHPDMPQFHGMVRESAAEVAALGARAKALGLREAKVKDLALRRLRLDLVRYAPDVAAQFGLERKDLGDADMEDAATADNSDVEMSGASV